MSLKIKSLLMCFILIGTVMGCAAPEGRDEILWDKWGVPHIYATSRENAFYQLGWAQMKAHGNLMAELYGLARGRGAEYWGAEHVENDAMIHMTGVPARARAWFDAQDEDYKTYITAFVGGINDYAQKHPDGVTPTNRVVLPIRPVDVMAHMQRVLYIGFLLLDEQRNLREFIKKGSMAALPANETALHGSNAYAVSPVKSASGDAMLVMNPHLNWEGGEIFFEIHLVTPDIDAYGVSMVGQPMISMGFTKKMGWAHTVNPLDGVDLYALKMTKDGYLMDGKSVPFEGGGEVSIKIKLENGEFATRKIPLLKSAHGPVIFINPERGEALAARFVGLDRPHAIKQYWDMLGAENLTQFEAVVSRVQVPYFNTIYADSAGDIFYLYNGIIADRKFGDYDYWRRIQPGDRADHIWSGWLGYGALPKFKNPATGFIQNSNDVPWSSTYPFLLKAEDYTPLIQSEYMDFRNQHATKMMLSDDKITFDELVDMKQSNHMELAARTVGELVGYARKNPDKLIQEAADLLSGWNRKSDAGSRAVLLFMEWADVMDEKFPNWFKTPWNRQEPLSTPRDLKDPQLAVALLKEAALTMVEKYGRLDVPYGDIYRLRFGKHDVPASVASTYYGNFSSGWFGKAGEDGTKTSLGGDTFIGVVEFGENVRAKGLLTYGNSTQDGSIHKGDQLKLFSERKLRTFWTARSDIEANLELRETMVKRPHL